MGVWVFSVELREFGLILCGKGLHAEFILWMGKGTDEGAPFNVTCSGFKFTMAHFSPKDQRVIVEFTLVQTVEAIGAVKANLVWTLQVCNIFIHDVFYHWGAKHWQITQLATWLKWLPSQLTQTVRLQTLVIITYLPPTLFVSRIVKSRLKLRADCRVELGNQPQSFGIFFFLQLVKVAPEGLEKDFLNILTLLSKLETGVLA